MKRKLYTLVIALLALAILFVLACSENTNELYDIEREITSVPDLKCVTEKQEYSVDDMVIRYTITNIGEQDGWVNSSDECFALHKLVDGKWKFVGEKVDHFWTEMAQQLPPKDSETREINLDKYFYLPLEKGEYRIVIENVVSNTFKIS